MRVVHADRQLQGPRRERHAVVAARAGRARRSGGQLRQRRRRGVRLRRCRRPEGHDHGARIHQPGEDRADARARRRAWSSSRARGRPPPTPPIRRSETTFYASHNWHPFFLHGTKTLAYELWEDLGFRAPDNIITPCGAGSNVLGCEIGFAELLRAGEIDTMPRIFAAQPENCGPIAAAFIAGSDTAGRHRDPADHCGRHRDRSADPPDRSARRSARNAGRRSDAERGGDRGRHTSSSRASASMSNRPPPRPRPRLPSCSRPAP